MKFEHYPDVSSWSSANDIAADLGAVRYVKYPPSPPVTTVHYFNEQGGEVGYWLVGGLNTFTSFNPPREGSDEFKEGLTWEDMK